MKPQHIADWLLEERQPPPSSTASGPPATTGGLKAAKLRKPAQAATSAPNLNTIKV